MYKSPSMGPLPSGSSLRANKSTASFSPKKAPKPTTDTKKTIEKRVQELSTKGRKKHYAVPYTENGYNLMLKFKCTGK